MWTYFMAEMASQLHHLLTTHPTPLPEVEKVLNGYGLTEEGLPKAIQTAYQHSSSLETFNQQITQLIREKQQNSFPDHLLL